MSNRHGDGRMELVTNLLKACAARREKKLLRLLPRPHATADPQPTVAALILICKLTVGDGTVNALFASRAETALADLFSFHIDEVRLNLPSSAPESVATDNLHANKQSASFLSNALCERTEWKERHYLLEIVKRVVQRFANLQFTGSLGDASTAALTLALVRSPRAQDRSYATAIIAALCQRSDAYRASAVSAMVDVLEEFIDGRGVVTLPFGVREILELCAAWGPSCPPAVRDRILHVAPAVQRHILFFQLADSVAQCCSKVAAADPARLTMVMKRIIRCWPKGSTAGQGAALELLAAVLCSAARAQPLRNGKAVYAHLRNAMVQDHAMVALLAVSVAGQTELCKRAGVPSGPLVRSIQDTLDYHWSTGVREGARSVLHMRPSCIDAPVVSLSEPYAWGTLGTWAQNAHAMAARTCQSPSVHHMPGLAPAFWPQSAKRTALPPMGGGSGGNPQKSPDPAEAPANASAGGGGGTQPGKPPQHASGPRAAARTQLHQSHSTEELPRSKPPKPLAAIGGARSVDGGGSGSAADGEGRRRRQPAAAPQTTSPVPITAKGGPVAGAEPGRRLSSSGSDPPPSRNRFPRLSGAKSRRASSDDLTVVSSVQESVSVTSLLPSGPAGLDSPTVDRRPGSSTVSVFRRGLRPLEKLVRGRR